MTTEAIIMMIVSMTVLWGGLAFTSVKLIRHNRQVAKAKREG